jgi:hypothetical protein
MLRKISLYVFFVSVFFVGAQSTEAALLYFAPDVAEVHRGDTITLALRLDTDEEECINTVDATISYDSNIRAVDVSRGNSILSIWVEDPLINETEHTVSFAGGIPGGYCGRVQGDPRLSNIIAEIVFRVPGLTIGAGNNPEATITLQDTTQVLLHDGLGTQAPLSFQNAKITLLDKPGQTVDDDWNTRVSDDDIPPADFTITLARDLLTFNGKHYIVFNSIDKQSGIDHYEVLEESFDTFELFSWGAATAPWREATSPYVLKDQSLNSTIYVRVIDKAGNETVSKLVPDVALRSMSKQRQLVILAVAVTGIVVFGILLYALWRRKRDVEAELSRTTPTEL